MTSKNGHVFFASCLIAILITSCSRDARYDLTIFHPLKYDHLVYSLLQLEPKSQGFLKNILMYCEIHMLDGSIKRLELHMGNHVVYEGKNYHDEKGSVIKTIELLILETSPESIVR
jgi:hypothetical protein